MPGQYLTLNHSSRRSSGPSLSSSWTAGVKQCRKKSFIFLKIRPATYRSYPPFAPTLGARFNGGVASMRLNALVTALPLLPTGIKTGGPSPRAMDTLQTEVQDGRLMVKYQYFRQLIAKKEVIG